jgi:hypothetical protein
MPAEIWVMIVIPLQQMLCVVTMYVNTAFSYFLRSA